MPSRQRIRLAGCNVPQVAIHPGRPDALRHRVTIARLRLGLLLLATLACLIRPELALAQDGGPADEPLPRPLDVLLEQRAALDLTPDQIGQVDRIQERLAADNEPLVSQMMSLRTQWQQARRAARNGRPPDISRIEQIRSAAQDLQGRIQANNRTAMQSVNRLLKPAQRKQLRAIVEKRRQQQGPGRRAGTGSTAGAGR